MTTRDRTRVLLLEDDPSALEASSLYLSHLGYEVSAVATADDAMRDAGENPPDVVVCDWQLGAGANGVDVARELQRQFAMPLVFMTAYPIDELREAAADLDVACFLKKPLSLPILADAIGKL
ncbi:MAG: response regulator [Gammaproteobacteria bacterium]|nr:response regulator [Gammaproteobacteria bacterium]